MNINFDFAKLARHPSIMRALTGLTCEKLQELAPVFGKALLEVRASRKGRQRAPGAGSKGVLDTNEKKLFYVLFYLKVYPTQRVQGFLFNKPFGKVAEEIRVLRQALEKALGWKLVLPKRRINSMEAFFSAFPEVKEVMVDGLERSIQRPKKQKSQVNNYSGKKKRHTRKNVVMTDSKRRILALSPTKAGRRHDQRLLDKAGWVRNIPPEVLMLADTAFTKTKSQHPNAMTPKRGSKNHSLTPADKQDNQIVSSFRIPVEHAIGGMKRFGVMAHRLRNRLGEFDDQTALLSAGLWNFLLAPAC
jgi:hypothetical protein